MPAWLLSSEGACLSLLLAERVFDAVFDGLIVPVVPLLPGTLLPRLPSEPGMTLLTIRIEKIGLKDAGQCIDPYITVSVKGQHSFSVCGFPSARRHAAFSLEQLLLEMWLPCLKQLTLIHFMTGSPWN